jgi:hypothetical protein
MRGISHFEPTHGKHDNSMHLISIKIHWILLVLQQKYNQGERKSLWGCQFSFTSVMKW